MGFLRRLAGRSETERVTNDEIQGIMNNPNTILDVKGTKQLRWYERVKRKTDDRLPKQIIKWNPRGGRKKTDLEEAGEMQERQLDENQ